MGTRLEILIKELDLSKTEFAKSIGKTLANISKYVKEQRSITKNFANEIIKVYPNVSYDWLRFGKGEIFKSTNIVQGQVIRDRDDTNALLEILKKENEVLREKISYYESRERREETLENDKLLLGNCVNKNK